MAREPGYVYLIHCMGSGLYKIGTSRSPISRVKQIQRCCPEPLEFVWCQWVKEPHYLEDALHRRFAKAHSHGEWFCLTDQHVDWLEDLDGDTIEQLLVARARSMQLWHRSPVQQEYMEDLEREVRIAWGKMRQLDGVCTPPPLPPRSR